ncbi:hypothetical protein [Pseudomonas sp. NPDC087626]|uniref:hypothetical protein n=1 Tax=Pseudomonas sp. NPDC087626 TaxID=3364444 RepID=UPI00380F1836
MLVLLGAGASFGSEPLRVSTPPLGNDLFSRLFDLGGVASKVSPELKLLFEDSFELGMAEFYERHSDKMQVFHREMAAYLASFRPRYKSYYRVMIDSLKDKNVVFASLNYDLMFELAAGLCGRPITYNHNDTTSAIRLLKPHGSINFWPRIPPEQFVNCVFGGTVSIDVPVKVLSLQETIVRCKVDTSLSPAISMYAKGKKNIVGPDFVMRQKTAFAEVCKSVDDILILGVRVVQDDTHIWDSISGSKARVTYFGGGNDGCEVSAWSAQTGKYVNFVNGFFPSLLQWIDARK